MKINIIYMGQLAIAAKTNEEVIEVAQNNSAQKVVQDIASQNQALGKMLIDENNNLITGLLIAVNDHQIQEPSSFQFSENDTLMLISPMAGG